MLEICTDLGVNRIMLHFHSKKQGLLELTGAVGVVAVLIFASADWVVEIEWTSAAAVSIKFTTCFAQPQVALAEVN